MTALTIRKLIGHTKKKLSKMPSQTIWVEFFRNGLSKDYKIFTVLLGNSSIANLLDMTSLAANWISMLARIPKIVPQTVSYKQLSSQMTKLLIAHS